MNLSSSNNNNQIQLENFKVLPKFVGTWQGQWTRLDRDGNVVERFTSILNQKIVNNHWVQNNQHQYPDGKIVKLSFFGTIVKDGTILFESPDHPYSNFLMLVEEHGDNLIIISVSDKITGSPLATETINLIDKNQRIRTLQQFQAPDGNLSGFMIVIEHKDISPNLLT
jgi:hypothetical protein